MNNYKLKLFDGSLREAVNITLKENNYPVLPLVQKREKLNIEECSERQSMLDFEDKFANVVKASRLRMHYLTYMYSDTGIEVDKIAHDKLAEEHPNSLKVDDYYRNQLYTFLLNKAEKIGIKVTDREKYYLFTDDRSREIMERFVSCLIEKYGGIEKFQNFIKEYNQYVMSNYLTNEEIVSLSNKNKKVSH